MIYGRKSAFAFLRRRPICGKPLACKPCRGDSYTSMTGCTKPMQDSKNRETRESEIRLDVEEELRGVRLASLFLLSVLVNGFDIFIGNLAGSACGCSWDSRFCGLSGNGARHRRRTASSFRTRGAGAGGLSGKEHAPGARRLLSIEARRTGQCSGRCPIARC
jgi:hypothetical protein